MIWRRVDTAGDDTLSFWREHVKPWFRYWPITAKSKDPSTSFHLVEAALSAGQALPEVVADILNALNPVEHLGQLLFSLAQTNQVANFPLETIKLLAAVVTSDNIGYEACELRSVLNRVSDRNDVVASPAYQQLDKLLEERGA